MAENPVDGYFETRLAKDEKRSVLWTTLWDKVFSRYVRPDDTVVELGAGWCDFINSVTARRRIALDLWDGVREAAADGVETHVGSALDLSFLADGTVDVVFASNLVEHLTLAEARTMFAEATRVLRPGGRVVLVQPNYRLCTKQYFDDYTHVSVWTDASLPDFLTAEGFSIEEVRARFTPLTVKSRLPVSRKLIEAYLASPVKPKAGQMLVVARTRA